MEKRRKRSRSKRLLANLTEDLIIEILLRLPVSSIGRFRCICKAWYSLLTHDVRFAEMKLDYDTRKGDFKLLLTTCKEVKSRLNYKQNVRLRSLISNDSVKIEYPLKKQSQHIHFLGSCNGLICVTSFLADTIYVWNPCTKEYKVILSPEKPNHFASYYTACGFGYDSKACDYKFVSILGDSDMDVSRVEIYTLGSDSWKTYSNIPYKVCCTVTGVFLSGALHWLAKTIRGNDSKLLVILSFNLADETFKEVPLPEHMDYFNYLLFDVLRGCLCLLSSVSKISFEIWLMKDYGVGESWVKLLKTDPQMMMTDIPSYHHLCSAVSLKNSEMLLHVRLGTNRFKTRPAVVRICLEENGSRLKRKKYRYNKRMVQMVPYMESLVSVSSGVHVGDE